jgi:cell division protein ZapA
MSVVTLQINDKNFQLACKDGEENKLKSVASILDKKIKELKASIPTASTEVILTICALQLQSEQLSLESKITDNTTDKDDSETLSIIASNLENLLAKIKH